jgi:hypothetical protein
VLEQYARQKKITREEDADSSDNEDAEETLVEGADDPFSFSEAYGTLKNLSSDEGWSAFIDLTDVVQETWIKVCILERSVL